MKRSKIFLGATTCCLAIAAVAAAKIQKSFIQATRYYCTSTAIGAKCIPYVSQTTCDYNGSASTCFYFTKPSAPTTSKKYVLYTNFGNSITPTCGQATNCKTKVTYDINIQ